VDNIPFNISKIICLLRTGFMIQAEIVEFSDMDFSNLHKDFLRYHSTLSETKKSGFMVQDK